MSIRPYPTTKRKTETRRQKFSALSWALESFFHHGMNPLALLSSSSVPSLPIIKPRNPHLREPNFCVSCSSPGAQAVSFFEISFLSSAILLCLMWIWVGNQTLARVHSSGVKSVFFLRLNPIRLLKELSTNLARSMTSSSICFATKWLRWDTAELGKKS